MLARHSASNAYYPGSYSAAFLIALKIAKFFASELHTYRCSPLKLIDSSQYFLKLEDKLRYVNQSGS